MSRPDERGNGALAVILRDLARQIESIDDAELAQIMSGAAKLKLHVVGRRKQRPAKHSRVADEELLDLGATLRTAGTRDEGNKLLDERITSKDDMARLAKQLDIPVHKGESAEQIRNRIIESTIGFRLRSAAIQGVSGATSGKPTGGTN